MRSFNFIGKLLSFFVNFTEFFCLDENIPTVRLNVPNTNYGHCVKTRAILDDIFNQMKGNKNLKWAVITDDDTILRYALII